MSKINENCCTFRLILYLRPNYKSYLTYRNRISIMSKFCTTAFTVIILLIFLIPSHNFAQTIDKNNTFWASAVPVFKLTDKIKINTEFHWRRSEFVKDWMQLVLRPSINYTPIKGVTLSFGYTFANNHPYHEWSGPIAFPEHNLWEQVVLKSTYGKVKVTHRFRLENRWLGLINNTNTDPFIDGNRFTNRFRYRLIGNVPLFKLKNTPVSLTLFDELFIVLSDKLAVSSVNQNWIVGLVNFHLPQKSKVSIGIQNQYIVRNGEDRIVNTALWLGLSKEFDLTNKKKK